MKTAALSIVGYVVLGGLIGALATYSVVSTSGQSTDAGDSKLREGVIEHVGTDSSTYTNSALDFSLTYPNELVVKEFDEGGGARTILFQKPGEQLGFQIFIVPYERETVSAERIKQELPGVPIGDVVEVIIGGGMRAVHFTGKSPEVGETTEVWFVRNGYLYQITTYKAQDVWLGAILSTLAFD